MEGLGNILRHRPSCFTSVAAEEWRRYVESVVRTAVMKPFFPSNGEIALNKAFFWYREIEEIEILNEKTHATPNPTNPPRAPFLGQC